MKGTITPVTLIRHQPIGTSTGYALVDWRDDSSPYGLRGGVGKVTRTTYAPSPEGEAFRTARHRPWGLGRGGASVVRLGGPTGHGGKEQCPRY